MPISTRREEAKKAIKRRRWRKPRLTFKQILAWADEHFRQTAEWPTAKSRRVRGTLEEHWASIDVALRIGWRGLRGGDSLARLLAQYRGVRNRKGLPSYTVSQILVWADAYHTRHGEWPNAHAGPIELVPGETWMAVSMALSKGRRGLPGDTTLARLLAQRRGVRNSGQLPKLKISDILRAADEHYRATGLWPTTDTGRVAMASGETWLAIDQALRNATRGLRGDSSLARLLYRRRGVPLKSRRLPPLHVETILHWADDHHKRTGEWPDITSGPIPAAPGETWGKIANALREGKRGMAGGSSLARLLAEHRGVRNIQQLPHFTIRQILAWADAYFAQHQQWPTKASGPIADSPGDTWTGVNFGLSRGNRGLPGGSSLAQLLAERRGARNRYNKPRFSVSRILAWADAYHARTGMWPNQTSGAIAEAPREEWRDVDRALRRGLRGVRGGSSLARFLQRHRRVLPKHRRRPPLAIDDILAWADKHHEKTGHWPRQTSGKVPEAPAESWGAIDVALRVGQRGLPGGMSLGRLWAARRGARNQHSLPRFSAAQILAWADAYRQRTGQWPQVRTGSIAESPDDNWMSIDNALRLGLRGMHGGSSLRRFLLEHWGKDKG